eukprot:g7119.t1
MEEPAEAPEAPPVKVEDMPKLTIGLLELVKNAQQSNGLRHGDYQRYRQYCTRRLRRIRKSVKLKHGKGRKFVPLAITPDSVSDVRTLMIPLFNAERVWAHAMQLKNEMVDSDNSRLKFHLARQLVKAARWGREVSALYQARCDARTSLEAEAYGAVMCGHLALEREQFSEALQHFSTATRICAELGTVGTVEQQDLFAQRVEELKPRIRYCRYQLDMGDDGADGGSAADLVSGAAGDRSLQAKLKAVLSDSLNKAAEKMDTVQWCGHSVPVRSEAVRLAMLQLEEKGAELTAEEAARAKQLKGKKGKKGKKGEDGAGLRAGAGEEDEGLRSLEFEIFGLFDDALRAVGKEERAMDGMKSGAKVDEQRGELAELKLYLARGKLLRAMARNQRLLADTEARLALQQRGGPAAAAAGGGGAGRRPVRADDMVHLFDLVLDNLDELLAQTPDGTTNADADAEQREKWEAQQLAARAARVFYVAEAYAAQADKWGEAALLYVRAAELAAEAAAVDDSAETRALCARAESARHRARAECYLAGASAARGEGKGEDESKGADASAGAAAPGSPRKARRGAKDDAAAAPVPRTLLERQARFDAGDAAAYHTLTNVPPALRPIPCKPLFFDIASNAIRMPDLAALSGDKKKKKKKAAAKGKEEAKGGGGWFGGLLGGS